MMKFALQAFLMLLEMVSRDVFVDVIDAAIDKVEAKYHDDPSEKGRAIMAACATVRRLLNVPDDDVDQGSPV
jgi:hypothetical protein